VLRRLTSWIYILLWVCLGSASAAKGWNCPSDDSAYLCKQKRIFLKKAAMQKARLFQAWDFVLVKRGAPPLTRFEQKRLWRQLARSIRNARVVEHKRLNEYCSGRVKLDGCTVGEQIYLHHVLLETFRQPTLALTLLDEGIHSMSFALDKLKGRKALGEADDHDVCHLVDFRCNHGHSSTPEARGKAFQSQVKVIRLFAKWKKKTPKRLAFVYKLLKSQDVDIRLATFRMLVASKRKLSIVAPILLRLLKDKEDKIQIQLLLQFTKFGVQGEPYLRKLIKHKDAKLRKRALQLLHIVKHRSDENYKRLLHKLEHGNKHLQKVIFSALEKPGRNESGLIWVFLKALENEEEDVRNFAAEILGKMGSERRYLIPILSKRLVDKDEDLRHAAVIALGKIQPSPLQAIPALVKASRDTDETVRYAALDALAAFGTKRRVILQALVRGLKDKDSDVRESAAEGLLKLKSSEKWVIKALIRAVKDTEEDVQRPAIEALAALGSKARSAIPTLLRVLHGGSNYVREESAKALGKIGKGSAKVIKALKARYPKEKELDVKVQILQSLGWLGKESRDVAAFLTEILSSKHSLLLWYAVVALEKTEVDSTHVRRALCRTLKASNARVRKQAALVFGKWESDDDTVISALIATLRDKDAKVREASAEALGMIGTAAIGAMPALLKALQDRSSDVRYTAAYAFEQFGEKAHKATPALLRALKDKEQMVRYYAVRALGEIKAKPDLVIPTLSKLLVKDKNEDVRLAILGALNGFGLQKKGVLPTLVRALKDPSKKVQGKACKVLGAADDVLKVRMVMRSLQKGKDVVLQKNAKRVLTELDKQDGPKRAVRVLLTGLKATNPYIRAASLKLLGTSERVSQSTYALILMNSLIEDKSARVRMVVLGTIAQSRSLLKKTTTGLILALHDKDVNIRKKVLQLLSKRKSLPEVVFSTLLLVVKGDKRVDLRKLALQLIVKKSQKSGIRQGALTLGLLDDNKGVRKLTVQLLHELGAYQMLFTETLW